MLYASDLISQYLPWYYQVAKYLKQNQLPHWVEKLYDTGYPILALGESGTLSPINALILKSFPFPASVNILYIAYIIIAFFGTTFFLKILKLKGFI